MKRVRLYKESYEVSEELADKLNSILADEWLASELYRYAIVAMVGNKNHQLEELSEENGKDEIDDHFKNLYLWMQSKGIKCVTNHKEMEEITNCTKFEIEDGMSTKEILDMLITAEEEAIDVYETIIPETDLDLYTMLCGFLKDERQHLKDLTDIQNEMVDNPSRGEPEEKHMDDDADNQVEIKSDDEEGADTEVVVSDDDVVTESDDEGGHVIHVTEIDWDADDPEDVADLPTECDVTVPSKYEAEWQIEDYISDYLTDTYGFTHNGFKTDYDEASEDDILKATAYISARKLKTINRCLSGKWTPEDMDVEPESEVLKVTGKFEDGCEADIILHASEDDFYTDGVLYDETGHQLTMTDVSYDFDGEWEFEVDGQIYVCNVVVGEEK